ncbi:hypothetical protein PBRA_009037 [Plasmodiophora brassicae]|uniref:Uncharacterized protein n=1 Tax=Plasmodiophora brassicae TaxID=37360 RepID=A0A0G4J490_PLABS|nr:hypothetical protein PBRA_009037 [Plasmodiophora brassicae]
MDYDGRAPFGAVARLHMVCWFDVRAQFVGVARGFYRPVVTCSLTENIPHWQGELSFSMRAIVHTGGDVPSMSVKESRRMFNSVTARYPEWGDLSLDPVHVGSCRGGGSKYARVVVEMVDHSHRWKRGFAIAAVRLEPVDEDAKEFSAPIPKSLRLCK